MRTHIYPLDAVRFLSALCVMFFHLGFYDWASRGSVVAHMFAHATEYRQAIPFTSFGWVGVEIFFVISGFVIANSADNSNAFAFAKSRVLRLYPAVWICAPVTLTAWLIVGGETPGHLASETARSVLLWIFGPWLDGVYWSLAVELVFYAVVFFVLVSGQFAKLSNVAWALAIISGGYLLAVTLERHAFSSSWGIFLVSHEEILLLRYGCFFAVGIWMWLYRMRGLQKMEWLGVAMAFGAGLLEIVGRAHAMANFEVQPGIPVSDTLPAAVWIGAVVFMWVVSRAPERFEPRSQRSKDTLKQLGLMTYPLYLVHSVVGAFLIRLLVGGGANPCIALAIAILSMLTLAYLVARHAEPAVRNVLRGVSGEVERLARSAAMLAVLFKPGGTARYDLP